MIHHNKKLSKKEQADRDGTGSVRESSSPSNGEPSNAESGSKPEVTAASDNGGASKDPEMAASTSPASSTQTSPNGFSLTQEPVVESAQTEDKELDTASSFQEYLGELAPDYGTRTIYLTARDPHCLYAYWDWDWQDLKKISAKEAKPKLRVHRTCGERVAEIIVNREARNWYVEVPDGNESYTIEIGMESANGQWESIAHSSPAHTPSDRFGSEENFSLASVPFHLHFDELLQTLKTAVDTGESLTDALGRLQAIGLPIDGDGHVLTELTDEQSTMLELLLGRETWDQVQSGSLDLASMFRTELESALSSGSASESLLRLRLASLVGGESSQLSGLVASWFSGSTLSSEVLAGEWNSEVLASWRAAVGETSWQFAITSASWTAALGFESGGFAAASEQFAWLGGSEEFMGGSERLSAASEFLAGLGGSEALSSYRSKLMSWFAAPAITPESSWFSAGAGMSEIFSSWQMGVTGATGGMSSETLSSWGGRSFYMHVNAEVIFYGGTDPKAKVWIDGDQIELDTRGNFRYHFKFPDHDFEIPIVAESPDGVETRSATLYFKRDTKKQGKVDDTGQPENLTEPIGRVS